MNITPYFKMHIYPELNTISREDLLDISRAHWPKVKLVSSKGFVSIDSDYFKRHRRYDFIIKWLFWEKLKLEEDSFESFLIDLVPNIHWKIGSWKPVFVHPKGWKPDFSKSRVFSSSFPTPQKFIIPEIIRPYVDFVNSIDIASDIWKENFVGIINFMVYDGETRYLLVNTPSKALYCHLIYDSDGKITLVEGTYPNPDFSLKGYYNSLSRLFHMGEKEDEKVNQAFMDNFKYRPPREVHPKSKMDWRTRKYFKDDRNVPTAPLSDFLTGINTHDIYNMKKHFKSYYKVISTFRNWFYTLLLVENACTTHFDILSGQMVKECIISFDKQNRLRFQIHYHDNDIIQNHYPKSLYESICLLEIINRNLSRQITHSVLQMTKLKEKHTQIVI